MANDHYMPWFFGDFIASTMTWTGPERGLYALLLGTQWASGPLPNDLDRLARALDYEPVEFKRLWPVMAPKFKHVDGALINLRLEAIRAKNLEAHERRVAGGKATASLRWGSSANSLPTSPPNSLANSFGVAKLSESDSSATSLANSPGIASDPIRSISESDPEPNKNQEVAQTENQPLKTDAVQRNSRKPVFTIDRAEWPAVNWVAWDQYLTYRKTKRWGPLERRGSLLLAKHLSGFSAEVQQAMVDQSERCGWQGVFDLKAGLGVNGSAHAPLVHVRTLAEVERDEAAALAGSQTEGEDDKHGEH